MGHFHASDMALQLYSLFQNEQFTTDYDQYGDFIGGGSPRIENPKFITINSMANFLKERVDCCLDALKVIEKSHPRAFEYLKYMAETRYGMSASEGCYTDIGMITYGVEQIVSIWHSEGLLEKNENGYRFIKDWYDLGGMDKFTNMEIDC